MWDQLGTTEIGPAITEYLCIPNCKALPFLNFVQKLNKYPPSSLLTIQYYLLSEVVLFCKVITIPDVCNHLSQCHRRFMLLHSHDP